MESAPVQPDRPDDAVDNDGAVSAFDARPWERKPSRGGLSAAFGLQGKLILCFALLLGLALGTSCVIFLSQTRACLDDILGEQAQQFVSSLAWSSEHAMTAGSRGQAELAQAASNLIKGRNLVIVGFYDADGRGIIQRSRDPDFDTQSLVTTENIAAQGLMRVQRRQSKLFGEYIEVVAPVISSPRLEPGAAGLTSTGASARLLGYVKVGLSSQYEKAQLTRINMLVIGAGCVAAIMSLPLAYFLVHRVFLPIRQLSAATRRIIAGDLDTRVAVDRRDLIGDLARAFNEMVIWVRKQQQDVAAANMKLADANRDLEVKIVQRTAQFETANKRLSQEIAEKEEFLRAVSHDLNAPLRNISGMATMLLMKHKGKFDEDVIHRLERIKSNVDVETDLISELLELSRIKTRRQKMEVVDLEQLIWELRGLVRK